MPSPEIDLIKRDNPLERVMAQHGLKLQRRGGRFVARCPFHEEQHPSLVVYPDTRSFYCFGCRASGDVLDFVRRVDKVDFREAMRRLAGNGRDEHRPLPPQESVGRQRSGGKAVAGLGGRPLRSRQGAGSLP